MSARFTLYYWPIPFRGHIIRMILAYSRVAWEDKGFDDTQALKGLSVADQPYPFMAPPLLHDAEDDQWISQMPAITMHLGRKLGLSHDPDLELRLICDASDILFEITRGHGAQMWDRDSWNNFVQNRLPRWMQIHERLVSEMSAGGYLSGNTFPGLADLILAGLWHNMAHRLPPLSPVLQQNAPNTTALVDRVAGTPAIASFVKSWDHSEIVYCAGQIEASLLDMLEMN